MSDETRIIKKRPVLGTTEKRIFRLSFRRFTAELGAISSVVSCTLYDLTADEDVSTTGLSGSTSLSDPLVDCRTVDGTVLTDGHEYELITTVAYADGQQRAAKLRFTLER